MHEVGLTPVFPLNLAVCPGEAVPLHIFEPRYKEMIGWCRAEASAGRAGEFAIVLVEDGHWRRIGCVMRIVKILNEYDDGRLDLVAVGQRRCAIEPIESAAPYPTGRLTPYEDVQTDWDERLANEVFVHHRRLIALVTGKEPAASEYAGLTTLSYYVMPTAGLGIGRKQQLLEMTSENDRLRALSVQVFETVEALLRAHEVVNTIQVALKAHAMLKE